MSTHGSPPGWTLDTALGPLTLLIMRGIFTQPFGALGRPTGLLNYNHPNFLTE